MAAQTTLQLLISMSVETKKLNMNGPCNLQVSRNSINTRF